MDVEQRARELLAQAFEARGQAESANALRAMTPLTEMEVGFEASVSALFAALTPPEGFVLVPVEPTEAMTTAFWGKIEHGDHERAAAEDAWRDALAARPEVKA